MIFREGPPHEVQRPADRIADNVRTQAPIKAIEETLIAGELPDDAQGAPNLSSSGLVDCVSVISKMLHCPVPRGSRDARNTLKSGLYDVKRMDG